MSDENIKKQLRQIVVEMTKPKAWFVPLSFLIRLFQWKWWQGQSWFNVPSHSRVRFYDLKHQVWWIYEAGGTSVKLVGPYVMDKTKVVRQYEFYITREAKISLIRKINESIGKPYGFLQLVGLGLVKLLAPFSIKISNPFADGNKTEVCVEAVYWVLWEREDFRAVLSKYKPDTIDLCDLMEILKELEL